MGYANMNDVNGMREQGSDHRHVGLRLGLVIQKFLKEFKFSFQFSDYFENSSMSSPIRKLDISKNTKLVSNAVYLQISSHHHPIFMDFFEFSKWSEY